jgi:DNA (cytosine-5)-methyltransferase 1
MLAVDLFAGCGGFSEGAKRAGARVLWAANHWRAAVDVHALRHPETEHSCQDLHQADFSRLPDHDLMLASPACQGHSDAGQGARGRWGLPYRHHDSARATAFAVIAAAEAKRPRWIIAENVERFRAWQLYRHWTSMLSTLGYQVEEFVLDAADFGVPQNRRRIFVVARLGAAPGIEHQMPRPAVARNHRTSWRPMSTVLDVAGGSGWEPVASKSAQVQNRVARSRVRCGDLFLTQHVTDHYGRTMHQPLPTITGADQMAIVRGDEMRSLSLGEYLAGQGLPRDYLDGIRLTRREATKMIGNAVAAPVAEALVRAVCAVDVAASSPLEVA